MREIVKVVALWKVGGHNAGRGEDLCVKRWEDEETSTCEVFPDPQTLAIGVLNFLTFQPSMELFSKKFSKILKYSRIISLLPSHPQQSSRKQNPGL